MVHFTDRQFTKLSKLLVYLKNNNAYYKKVLSKYSEQDLLDKECVKEIYRNLNVTTKSGILDSYEEYLDPDVLKCFDNPAAARQYLLETNDLNKNHDKFFENNADAYAVETTSGTTGKAFPVVKSAAERFVAANYLLKCRKEHFPAANIKNGFLLAHEVDDYLRNTNYLHEKCDMHEVVDYFIDKKPKWIFVTANTIKRFSNAITNFNKGDEVRNLGVQFIEVTAATLSDEDKDRIEKLFNAPIRNQYGCREVWNIAYECKCGRMHINDSCLMVDLVDEKGNIIDEENVVGEVIVTSLYNKITPFVKYYLGDYASISYEECECGKKTPILKLQGGRKCEKLKNTKFFGSSVFRRVLRVLYFNKGLRYDKIKIVQDEEYHLSVYLSWCSDFELFKKKFVEISFVMIDNFSEFSVDFIQNYPFVQENTFLKENIFISLVN